MTDWRDIKSTGLVYPSPEISLFVLKTENGSPATGWVNNAYLDYPYKEHAPYNFLIMVDLTQPNPIETAHLDMGTIEDYFVNELRNICVAHIVGRLVTDVGLNIEMYLETLEAPMEHLQTLGESPNRLVHFVCEINEDPEWAVIGGLMALVKK